MQTQPITIKDLQALDDGYMQFRDQSAAYLAGRCLLDALEFLRNDPKWPARSGHLVNAHAIRLSWGCLKELRGGRAKRIQLSVEETYKSLRDGRNAAIPTYGDDFWDWAYILEAMLVVSDALKDAGSNKALANDINEFYARVKEKLNCGLTLNRPGASEWFGPAIPTAAHRLLRLANAKDYIEDKSGFDDCLSNLKSKALEPINNDIYLGRTVRPKYHQWHLGQVVAEFGGEADFQRKALSKIEDIDDLPEIRDQAYALARVVQGTLAVGDTQNSNAALEKLYKIENLSRPLGFGIVGDHPKASLNTLEAVWPSLKPTDFKKIREMVDVLIAARKRANRIGILVALPRERDACIREFMKDGAKQTKKSIVELNHKDYEVVIVAGKATIEAAVVVENLIKDHLVTRVLMVGIAGSLGTDDQGKISPGKGDVVIATSTAPFELRLTVRETPIAVPVPFGNLPWKTLPTDVTLFAHAHDASLNIKAKFPVHEGLVVTVNGVKDHLKEKARILKQYPGGLAIAEEGFPAALVSLARGVPYLEIRGISDLAQGDKKKQQKVRGQEKREQNLAATNAAKVAVALTKSLSKSWQ